MEGIAAIVIGAIVLAAVAFFVLGNLRKHVPERHRPDA
jgi:hypothetical protein